MTKQEIFASYGQSSPEDRRKFDRWLQASAVIASLFAAALLAMALRESGPPGPATATAKSRDASLAAQVKGQKPGEALSAYELMVRRGDQLPVQPYTEPF